MSFAGECCYAYGFGVSNAGFPGPEIELDFFERRCFKPSEIL